MSTATVRHARPGLFARLTRRAARSTAAAETLACKACSPLDYGKCQCPEDCGHLSCTGGQRAAAGEPHGIATPETLAALVARAQTPRQPFEGASAPGQPAPPTLPFTLTPQRHPCVPQASEVIPMVPLTAEAPIFDALHGTERTARHCGHCGAASGPADLSWRYDAHQVWTCPSCQAGPEWRSPSLPGLRIPATEAHGWEESRLIFWARQATNQRCVRQRPDDLWMAAIPIEGRIRKLGPFGHREDAEAVYGRFLAAFSAKASGTEEAA